MQFRPHLKAMLTALSAYALWVVCDVIAKLAVEAKVPVGEVLCFSGAVGLAALILSAIVTGNVSKLTPQKWGLVLLSSFLSAIATGCNVVAVKHLPLTVFYICAFSGPIVTAFLAAVLIGERLGLKKMIAIATGFAGVVIAINPSFSGVSGELEGYLAVFASVLAASFSWILVRQIAQAESLWSLNAVFFVVVVSGGGLLLAVMGLEVIVRPPLAMLILLSVAGLFGLAARFLITYAMRHTTAANVTQANYTQILWAAAVAFFIWGETPALSLILGGVLIVASGLAIAREAHRLDRKISALPVG